MSKYFGTDGFRGEAGITLTADHAYKVGRFLGWYYNALRERNGDTDSARIVIGKDTRRSSYMFEYSLVAGLTASGGDAYLLHVTTTPSVAYIARVDIGAFLGGHLQKRMSGRILCSECREESAVQGRPHTDLYDQNQAAARCGPAGEC